MILKNNNKQFFIKASDFLDSIGCNNKKNFVSLKYIPIQYKKNYLEIEETLITPIKGFSYQTCSLYVIIFLKLI